MPDTSNIDTAEFLVVRPAQEAAAPGPGLAVQFGARSHVGLVRHDNQDSYLISRMGRRLEILQTSLPDDELPAGPEDFAHVMVIADGMGGMAAGERASLLAIRTGMRLVRESPTWAMAIDDREAALLVGRLSEYFRKVDEAVIREVEADPSLAGMGTTLTVAYTVGTDLFLVHAGDSRAYLHRDGRLCQLTKDHTVPGRRNALTNYVGCGDIQPEVSSHKIRGGDRLLLCTDGLTNMVDDGQIASLLDHPAEPAVIAGLLVARALDRGGKDNVTALVARFAARD